MSRERKETLRSHARAEQEIPCPEIEMEESDGESEHDSQNSAAPHGTALHEMMGRVYITSERLPQVMPRGKIRRFSGTQDNYNVRDFIAKYQMHARAHYLDRDAAARQIALYLKGNCKEAYSKLEKSVQGDIKQVYRWLRTAFPNHHSVQIARSQLRQLRMKKGDHPQRFARKMLKLAELAHPDMDYEKLKSLYLEEFIYALPTPLRQPIQQLDPSSIDEAAMIAQRLATRQELFKMRENEEKGKHRKRHKHKSRVRRKHKDGHRGRSERGELSSSSESSSSSDPTSSSSSYDSSSDSDNTSSSASSSSPRRNKHERHNSRSHSRRRHTKKRANKAGVNTSRHRSLSNHRGEYPPPRPQPPPRRPFNSQRFSRPYRYQGYRAASFGPHPASSQNFAR